jgi:CDP-diacylglycerol--glycerol-3-phosphate 3-phosphatidyltransferase
VTQTINKEQRTFTDLARVWLKGFLDPIGHFLNRLGLTPNMITMVGLVGHILAAAAAALGKIPTAGWLIFILGPVDALDGTMARLRGESSQWGAFVDSVVDRYSELFIFGGLIYYFSVQGNTNGLLFTYLAASGSVLVSYVRARAQSLGFDTKIGLFSRFERYIVLVPALVFNFPVIGLAILAIGSHITALQRVYAMRRQVYTGSE